MSKMADDAAIEAEEKRRLKLCRKAFDEWYEKTIAYDWAASMSPRVLAQMAYLEGAAWNHRSGEDDAEKQYKKLLVLQGRTRQLTGNHHRLQAKYTALLADVERVIADAIKYEWQEGMILDKLDTVLTRIHNKHKEGE